MVQHSPWAPLAPKKPLSASAPVLAQQTQQCPLDTPCLHKGLQSPLGSGALPTALCPEHPPKQESLTALPSPGFRGPSAPHAPAFSSSRQLRPQAPAGEGGPGYCDLPIQAVQPWRRVGCPEDTRSVGVCPLGGDRGGGLRARTGRASPRPQAKGTICLMVEDEPAHPPPAPSGHSSQPPWATCLSPWIWMWAQLGPVPAPAKSGDLPGGG